MATDDRDTDSANPSKSFKVGEFDRLSGFFTPVWESKRRLRADSPVPSSSAAASAPSSARGAEKGATSRPSTPPPPAALVRRSSPPPAPARRPSSPPAEGASTPAQRPSSPPLPPARRPSAPPAATAGATARQPSSPPPAAPALQTERPRNARASSPPRAAKASAAPEALASSPRAANAELTPLMDAEVAPGRGAAPLAAPSQSEDGSAATLAPGARQSPSDSAADASPPPSSARPLGQAAVDSDPNDGDARVAAALHAAAAVTVRPVIPMPTTPPRAASRPKVPSSSPSAAAVGLKQAGPQALRDREPEARAPVAAPDRRGGELRSARAGAAATALHDKLRTKLPSESVDTFARHRETESEREAIQAAAARAAATPADPYPSQVLRRLRRTIHLSTPLPEAVRQMLEKYRY